MKRLPSTSSMYAPDARRMKSGAAPTAVNARTGLSTPPGRIRCAREKRRDDRDVRTTLPVLDCRELADGGGDEALLVFVMRAAARRVERARGAVEIARVQKHRRDA